MQGCCFQQAVLASLFGNELIVAPSSPLSSLSGKEQIIATFAALVGSRQSPPCKCPSANAALRADGLWLAEQLLDEACATKALPHGGICQLQLADYRQNQQLSARLQAATAYVSSPLHSWAGQQSGHDMLGCVLPAIATQVMAKPCWQCLAAELLPTHRHLGPFLQLP